MPDRPAKMYPSMKGYIAVQLPGQPPPIGHTASEIEVDVDEITITIKNAKFARELLELGFHNQLMSLSLHYTAAQKE